METAVMKSGNFETGLTVKDPAAIAAAEMAKARIQSAYVMALQKPRNEDQARVNILEACKRPAFAERVEFSKPVAGKLIKGPSVRFAEHALRAWGNVLDDVQTVFDDERMRRVKVYVTDLETNTTMSKEIVIAKTVERSAAVDRVVVGERTNTNNKKVFIVLATDEELQNKENAAISKAIRNEGLRLIPSDIVDEAISTARRTLMDRDAKDPRAAQKAVLDAFAEIGIKPKNLEQFLGHGIDLVSPMELQTLRGMYTSIRDGEASWSDYVSQGTGGKDKDPAAGATKPDTTAFERLIKGKDVAHLEEFLTATAKANRGTVDQVKAEAGKDEQTFGLFWGAFEKWRENLTKKQASQGAGKEKSGEKGRAGGKQPVEQAQGSAGKEPETGKGVSGNEEKFVTCPIAGEDVEMASCEGCSYAEECGAAKKQGK